MHRSKATARGLFPDRVYCEIDVEEVPLKSFVDCSIRMPLWIWNIMGRLQWLLNSSRQKGCAAPSNWPCGPYSDVTKNGF